MNSSATVASVTVTRDRIHVERLELADASIAAFVAEHEPGERPALVERALRIGLLTISNAGISMSADVVKQEFERLTERLEATQARATTTLEQLLRANFADGDGRLPRTLEAFLGDQGKLRRLTEELFDPNRREGAMGQLRDLLGRYFDGDGSRLAQLLDPTREGSPLHQFRNEMTGEFRSLSERIAALEAANRARAEERAHGTAKGTDFEDVLEERLAALAHGAGDYLERTGAEAGEALRSKKGDFVLTIDPSITRGTELRVVIEAKDRSMSRRAMTAELADARANRAASAALVVFSPQAAPTGIAPFALVGTDVYAVLDPEADDGAGLEAAMRLARALALLSLRESDGGVDVPAICEALDEIGQQLAAVQGMKAKLTSIGSAATEVKGALDLLRAGILRSVHAVEDQLRATDPARPPSAPERLSARAAAERVADGCSHRCIGPLCSEARRCHDRFECAVERGPWQRTEPSNRRPDRSGGRRRADDADARCGQLARCGAGGLPDRCFPERRR